MTERVLKKAILHRKNALFYRTLNGAYVGDTFMSLIHTAELNHVAPFEYLVALQRHGDAVAANPADWMPWNYQATLAQQNPGPEPPRLADLHGGRAFYASLPEGHGQPPPHIADIRN